MATDFRLYQVQYTCVYLVWLNSVRAAMLAMAQNVLWKQQSSQQHHELSRQLANPLAQEVFLKGLRMLAYMPFICLEDPRNDSGHSQHGKEKPPLASALNTELQVRFLQL